MSPGQFYTSLNKPVMDSLVDQCQSAFVPGRLITDNIILSHELVKGGSLVHLGLVANIDKSSIYFRGVNPELQQSILQCLGFTQGDLPFRYLGIPLSTKRLSILQCKPLIDKMLARIQSWTTKFLSYAGRAQLVIELVEATCRTFLWTGDVSRSKKALIAWERLSLPRVAGGLNILDIYTWNQAAIGKMLWNICRKKDTLWVKWIHTYYVKTGEIWNTKAAQASWMVKKILKATWLFDQTGWSENMVAGMETCSIKWFYKALKGDHPKVVWRRLFCNNSGLPKWLFILYLALNRSLQTKDRIVCWANLDDPMCPLCTVETKDIDHMLFKCAYATEIWEKLLVWQSITRPTMGWNDEVHWAIPHAKGKASTQEVYRMALAGAVYHVWKGRNARVFKEEHRSPEQVTRNIIQEVHYRAARMPKLDGCMLRLNFYP
ncbi:uncharacterized protein LOC132637842 [Lycium barbarum]|uniref:uncharacterized protein LOC132637842 n=1 Tax=Lycium barbarum TaxID=112863 RepID=UPI00293E317C|nr:uncharacterized protein LOC132637842 [Lycium barbarum]